MDEVLKAVIERFKPPTFEQIEEGKKDMLRAFLFDARYVPNRGVACLIKVMGGG